MIIHNTIHIQYFSFNEQLFLSLIFTYHVSSVLYRYCFSNTLFSDKK